MEKTYSIQGQTFHLLPNDLSLLNKAAPMIARLRRLSYEYTKEIDLSPVNGHKAKIQELNEAKAQVEELLNCGVDENGNELSEERKNELQQRIPELSDKLNAAITEFDEDFSAKNLLRLKEELESYALIELLTDVSFLKPVLKKILTGGNIESVDFTDSSAISFIRDVVTDFFTVMNRGSLKL